MATKGNGKTPVVNPNLTQHQISTKLAEGSPKVDTALALDWEGTTEAQCREWASRTIIINVQRSFRDANNIPAQYTAKVADFMSGKGRPAKVPLTPEQKAAALVKDAENNPDVARKLIEQLQASLKQGKQPRK